MFLKSVAKRRQLLNVADWISRDTMPVRVDEPVPLVSVARVAADRGRAAVMLLNAGMDPIAEATVRVRCACRRARLLAPGRRASTLETTQEANGLRVFPGRRAQLRQRRMLGDPHPRQDRLRVPALRRPAAAPGNVGIGGRAACTGRTGRLRGAVCGFRWPVGGEGR